ncbi:solute carrier family 22 member 13-like [Synchiropus picturatus]
MVETQRCRMDRAATGKAIPSFSSFWQTIGNVHFIEQKTKKLSVTNRLAQFLTVAPLSVVAIYIWFVPESARWLLYRGRTEEAQVLLARVAAINKRPFPAALLTKISVKDQVQESRTTVFFRSSVLRRNLLVITFAWFSGSLTYYCFSFNMGNFGLNIFLTQLIFGLTELPVHILGIWLLEAVGRKMSLMGTLLTAGFLCFMMLAFNLIPSIKQSNGSLNPVVNMMVLYH